ncbi:MAG: methyltransferase domain-containing protein [Chlamydiae bacterium]|nr:methyltransferase domain-containing protein [Chlamydiota bacterium]
MRSIGEPFQLFYTFFKVSIGNFLEERYVQKNFYKNLLFQKIDRELSEGYKEKSPYQISKEFLLQKGESDIHVYGETYLSTIYKVAKRIGISANDYIVEMGCGRGRASLFLASYFGCKVHGVDWIKAFTQNASQVAICNSLSSATFSCNDMLEEDLSFATVIYLYGTCLDDSTILTLISKFSTLPKGTKIITVSYSLLEYSEKPIFLLKDHFTARYPWGRTEIFIQELR